MHAHHVCFCVCTRVLCACVCTCDLCMCVHAFIISHFLYPFIYFWTSKLLASLGFYNMYSNKHGCVCSKCHGVTRPLIPAGVCARSAQLCHRAALILVFGGTSTLTSAAAAPAGVPTRGVWPSSFPHSCQNLFSYGSDSDWGGWWGMGFVLFVFSPLHVVLLG